MEFKSCSEEVMDQASLMALLLLQLPLFGFPFQKRMSLTSSKMRKKDRRYVRIYQIHIITLSTHSLEHFRDKVEKQCAFAVQWDVLSSGNPVSSVARISTGMDPGNCISIIQVTPSILLCIYS